MSEHTEHTAEVMLKRLEALETLGLPVAVRSDLLRRLATIPHKGPFILAKCLKVLEQKIEKKRYWPLLELSMVDRAVAEQCFPDAPSTIPPQYRVDPPTPQLKR
jgi:hypothetical protein